MKTNGYTECFKQVKSARTATPVNTEDLLRIRDLYGYNLYIECLRDVLYIQAFAENNGLSFASAERMLAEIDGGIDTDTPLESLRS